MLSGAATGLRFGNPDHFGNQVLGKTPFQRYDYGVSCELSAATVDAPSLLWLMLPMIGRLNSL